MRYFIGTEDLYEHHVGSDAAPQTKRVQIIPYLDDFLIYGQTQEEVTTGLTKTKLFLTRIGWKINSEKLIKIPSQSITYLGYIIDTRTQKIILLDKKISKLSDLSQRISYSGQGSRRDLMSLFWS